MADQSIPDVEKRLAAVGIQVEDLRDHARHARDGAMACESVPEIEDGVIPFWRREQFSDFEAAIYQLARAEALEFAAGHIEHGIATPKLADRVEEENGGEAIHLDNHLE
jgi:hypothetical protein